MRMRTQYQSKHCTRDTHILDILERNGCYGRPRHGLLINIRKVANRPVACKPSNTRLYYWRSNTSYIMLISIEKITSHA